MIIRWAANEMQRAFSVLAPTLTAIHSSLSTPRMATFLTAAGGDADLAIRLYEWNVQLCQSLYFPLQTAEVLSRNTVSEAIQVVFGNDWYVQPRFKAFLMPWATGELEKAVAEKKAKIVGRPLVAGDIVSQLSFGFWREMTKARYEKRIWKNGIAVAFKGIPQGKTRQDVYAYLDIAIKLRNRVSHHEPIFNDGTLHNNYLSVLSLIDWICPATFFWVSNASTFSALAAAQPQ